MPDRRTFVASLIGASVSLPSLRPSAFRHLFRAEALAGGLPPNVAEDETYWGEIQRAFDIDRTMVNLNNGGCSPAPTHVLEQMIRDIRFSNELPVDHMWRVLEPRIESVRRELKEAQAVHAELRLDLDYVEARLAGQPADALLEQRKASAKAGSKK